MDNTVLITGGTGLIGKLLSQVLIQKGYTVHHLSRNKPSAENGIKTFIWDLNKKKIDHNCIEGVSTVIHLAGEAIAAHRWTKKQKDKLIKSRTESIHLVYSLLQGKEHQVRTIISASGVGYYGNRGDELLTEESKPGVDFLANTCIEWEKAVEDTGYENFRIVKLRTGVVLSKEGGALAQMDKPIRYGVGAALGTGKQWMPWIYLDDLVEMYVFMIENPNIKGVFNAASPEVVTNEQMTKAIAQQLKKPLILPNVPDFALQILLGEMKAIVLNSTKTSAQKIIHAGFDFNFPDLAAALNHVYAG